MYSLKGIWYQSVNAKEIFMKKILTIVLTMGLLLSMTIGFASCNTSKGNKEKVKILSSAEDFRNDWYREELKKKFPQYDIQIEYKNSGQHGATLKNEGMSTEFDITFDLEYFSLEKIKDNLADLSAYDNTIFATDMISPDNKYLPEARNGGCIIVNTEVLAEKQLEEPKSYQDLLDPKYKGLISMPDPNLSGTGYMFLKSLVNTWGEEEAFTYFGNLSKNIRQFTSSGSGPVKALVQKEAAIGLGMTGDAVAKINAGEKLKILFFEEGSPYSLYGFAMIKGKETRTCVKEVFDYFYSDLLEGSNKRFYPEQIFKDKSFESEIENYPQNITHADMSNNTPEERDRLLEKWDFS